MSSPISSFVTALSGPSTSCVLTTALPLSTVRQNNMAVPMITAASYMIDSAGGTTAQCIIEELGVDNAWRALQPTQGSMTGTTAPANPIILTTAGKYSGTLSGQFHGLRLNFNIATATVNYAEIKGVVTSYA